MLSKKKKTSPEKTTPEKTPPASGDEAKQRQQQSATRKISNISNVEETEIAAHISLPPDGGWGWVVVAASFFSIGILDGVTYTFGALLVDITKDLQVSESLIALTSSTALALYFLASPLASALINRFGFRTCTMTGSILCTFALLFSRFSTSYISLFIFYGVMAGFGYCLINMAGSLVTGFYFQRLRAIAMAISNCGSSVGAMAMFPINTYLVKLSGWRATTLLHSGLFGLVFFLGLTYRPLVSLKVTKVGEKDAVESRPTIFLPSTASFGAGRNKSNVATDQDPNIAPKAAEKLFHAASSSKFPTVSAIMEMDKPKQQSAVSMQAGPSTASPSKITLTPVNKDINIKQVKSTISSASMTKYEIKLDNAPSQPKSPLHWESHVSESRPLYRDDAFYQGKIENLPAYKRIAGDSKTGIEYQMEVSRAATVRDIADRRGLMSTAMRRVLATMMDPSLLKRWSFILLCTSGFLTYIGLMVPYVYLQDRNLENGIDATHCSLFVSAISASNGFGRLILGVMASKLDPTYLFILGNVISGLATAFSDISYNLYYQYGYCCVFGFFISVVACLRSLVLVSLYGLEKLTNATGMMLIFVGLGNLISTPLAAVIKNKYGYRIAFYISGIFITLSGLVLIPVKRLVRAEARKISQHKKVQT